MTVKEMISKYFGTQYKMAEYLGVSEASVSLWVKHNHMPVGRAVSIQLYTNGEVQAADLVNKQGDLKHLLLMVNGEGQS